MSDEPSSKPKGLPAATVAKIAEFIDYQQGAVVSREIVKRSGGSVTLFAFDEGEGLTEHTSPFDAVVQILEGTADITVAGKSHRLQAGEMILMPALQLHALIAPSRYKMILTMIKP